MHPPSGMPSADRELKTGISLSSAIVHRAGRIACSRSAVVPCGGRASKRTAPGFGLAQAADGKLAMHGCDVTSSDVIHCPSWAHFSPCRRVVDF
jgi:hypothetical protein